ncbi:MAG: DUF1330 domain-containing protein [Dyella sp.]
MTAYVVLTRLHTTDPAELATYSQKAAQARAGHALTALAAYGKHEVLEGAPIEGAVILRFPSMDEARAWYGSPAYQEAKAHRLQGGDYHLFLIEGIDAPIAS